MIRRALYFFGLAWLLLSCGPAPADEGAFVLGIMNDQSGPYADLAGPGSVQAARMAIEDFGGSVLGKKIELLVADHQNKVDIGMAIAREWYDARGARVDFRHHQFGRRAGAAGSRQSAPQAGHLRFRFVLRSDRQRPVRRTAFNGTPTIGRTAFR